MDSICRAVFRAIHEGKWLSISYKNKKEEITKYWIGIKDICLPRRSVRVEGLHLGMYTLCGLEIYLDRIQSAEVIEGSYCEVNKGLVEDIALNPHKYKGIFQHVVNLKVLNYLADCSRLDTTPYKCEYSLIHCLDREKLAGSVYRLDQVQFQEIVKNFQHKTGRKKNGRLRIQDLAVNVMSIHTPRGLYVLAYRKLRLDVAARTLKPDEEITICREFTVDGEKQSIRYFLDGDELCLLDQFEENQELIKDKITWGNPQLQGVDDMPYLIAIGRDNLVDLHTEYGGILDMYQKEKVTYPLKAFFGDLVKRPDRRKEYPIVLLDKKANLDQLRAMDAAMKYPVAYVQGPPGTGKTNTIVNTILTAFFNDRTVLFASYNNHPIDGVMEKLQGIEYRGKPVPFPVIRLGNNEKVAQALERIWEIYQKARNLTIYDATLEKNKGAKIQRSKQLSELLKKRQEILDLKERKETIEKLLESTSQMTFQVELHGRQLAQINRRLEEIGEVRDEEALRLLPDDQEAFSQYLYYTSARFFKRLDEPKNQDLLEILQMEDKEERVGEFNRYLSKGENLKKFLRIFPVVATTCISAHKLADPEPSFDMTVIDEASQCNIAMSLLPIIRGKSLLLVGDPQQLRPVILLDGKDNQVLMKNYGITKEYNYLENSIYKAYLACDAVSDEILLSYHYRCHRKIIGFNNKKYYSDKLQIKSRLNSDRPLVFIDVKDNQALYKNTAPIEARRILEYAQKNRDKKLGVITPFANQKACISSLLKENGVTNVTCGTVHAFQGDEKDVILFSLALTDQTKKGTYQWLKNNKELLNVATSRAREQLVILGSSRELERLHAREEDDDVYELVQYVKTNGVSEVTQKSAASRALGIKPYSTQTEEAFLQNLNHALENILRDGRKCVIHKEVGIAHVFRDNTAYNDLFYSGRFDFVVYEGAGGREEYPILAIELDGKEHFEDEVVKERDRKKQQICRNHQFELIRIENSYARRYNHIKDILIEYFSRAV